MLDGLSEYLGNSYEFVLHSLENYEQSAIKVINGYYTGRKEGAPITDLALNMLEQIKNKKQNDQGIIYYSTNTKGEPLKSATIPIKGEHDRIIGLLCINFYMNTSLSDFLANFFDSSASVSQAKIPKHQENFSPDSPALIRESVQQIRNEVMTDQTISSSNRNKEIISRLNQRGVFNLKDAVILTARELNISKNTVYLHLRNLGNQHN